MIVKIVCILTDDDGNVVQEFTVVEFKAAEVVEMGVDDDASQN